jgi:hypothetical protein
MPVVRDAARAALTAAAVMLAYHVVTASVARGLELTWRQASWFELGIYLLYVASGFIASRWSGRLWVGIAAGVAAGLADAFVGWHITAILFRPMRIQYDYAEAVPDFIQFVVVFSALAGIAGAVAGRLSLLRWRRPRNAVPS